MWLNKVTYYKNKKAISFQTRRANSLEVPPLNPEVKSENLLLVYYGQGLFSIELMQSVTIYGMISHTILIV